MRSIRVVIQPFCSQQDKESHRFLLDADVTAQISRFLAASLKRDGFDVCLALPGQEQCDYPAWSEQFEIFKVYTPPGNRNQRLHFDPVSIRAMLDGCDLFITHNEIKAINLRQVVSPTLKIVHFNHLLPLGEWKWIEALQVGSWNAADLVVFLAPSLKDFAEAASLRCGYNPKAMNMVVWPMVFDESHVYPRHIRSPGNVDLLFVQRCSANNYTHHREFLGALSVLRNEYQWKGRVVFTDPTHYLELNWARECDASGPKDLGIEFARCENRRDYYELLHQAKLAIAMMRDDLHGGVAIREAIATGCLPVLLDEPCYLNLLGEDAVNWPFLVPKSLRPCEIARVVHQALRSQEQWQNNDPLDAALARIRARVDTESYQKAWQRLVREDLTLLTRS